MRDVFARVVTRAGGAVCIHDHGKLVVDLWGGIADPETSRPWERDTVTYLYSVTKGLTATCVHVLVARGVLDLNERVAIYWPEFAAQGKGHIPVHWLLSHRAGLPCLDAPIALEQALRWQPVIDALAAQRPLWPPGSAHGYHAHTFGFLAGELVRRVTGRTVGRFLAEEIANPLGLDLWIGFPEEQRPRLARILEPKAGPSSIDETADTVATRAIMITTPRMLPDDPRVHAAELPSTNGIGTARAVSRLYAGLMDEVGGVRILSPPVLATAIAEHAAGIDRVLRIPTRFGLGFGLPSESFRFAGPGSFGHGGRGGCVGYANTQSGTAFGCVMNRKVRGALPALIAAAEASAARFDAR